MKEEIPRIRVELEVLENEVKGKLLRLGWEVGQDEATN